MVRHACGGAARGAAGAEGWRPPSLPSPLGSHTAIYHSPRKPWAELLPGSPLHTLLTPLEGCPWEAGWCKCQVQVTAPSCPACHWGRCQGPSTWIEHLTPAENLMEKNPEGPDVRFDGSKALGRGPRRRSTCRGCCGRGKGRCPPASGHVWAGPQRLPSPLPPQPRGQGDGVLMGQCSRALTTATRERCCFPSDWPGVGGRRGGRRWAELAGQGQGKRGLLPGGVKTTQVGQREHVHGVTAAEQPVQACSHHRLTELPSSPWTRAEGLEESCLACLPAWPAPQLVTEWMRKMPL